MTNRKGSGGSHVVWWKFAPASLIGFALGAAAIAVLAYLILSQNMNEQYLATQWSSADKEWPAFADKLRHGGRRLILDGAFSAARNGMTETEVRQYWDLPIL
jgi:hypothetical protein